MAQFFKPSDIVTNTCTVSNRTRGGSAFAVCEDGEQVFISPKIVEITGIDTGDYVTAHCIPNAENHAVRWKAVRVEVAEKFVPAAAAAPAAPAEALAERVAHAMMEDRAWTATQLAAVLKVDPQSVLNILYAKHQVGEYACAKLYKRGDQERSSWTYYARTLDVLQDLIDEITLD